MPKGIIGSRGRIKLNCQNCNKDYYVIPSKKDTSKFCSSKCYHNTPRSEEDRTKQGFTRKEKYKQGIIIPYNKGKTKENCESLKRASEKLTGHKLSEETKEKIHKKLKGRIVSQEGLNKIIKIHKEKRGRLGYINSPESRIKGSKTRKILFSEGKIIHPFKNKKRPKHSEFMKEYNKTHIYHHTEEDKIKMSKIQKELMKDPIHRDKVIKAVLKGLMKRPTSYEKKISELCIENNLPFVYTGDGTFLIGHKNPDFVNQEGKIAIEVYHNYFKEKIYGSCENYEKQRGEYFLKYGYRTIFIRTEEIENKNWEEICLNKINKGWWNGEKPFGEHY